MNCYVKILMVLSTILSICSSVQVLRQYPLGSWGYPPQGPYPPLPPPGCPDCAASVFSYCSHKLVHDSCCCGDGYYTGNAFDCQYMDCSYLYANSCRESELITTCCCNGPFKKYTPVFNTFVKK